MARHLVPWEARFTRPLDRLQDEMSGLFRRFFGDEDDGWSTQGFAPPTNVVETETSYEVTAELPGVRRDEVNVELHDGALIISGKKEHEAEEKGKTFHRVERFAGEFRRVITLPPAVDEERIDASFKDGVLTVTVPKAEAAKPKPISIRSE